VKTLPPYPNPIIPPPPATFHSSCRLPHIQLSSDDARRPSPSCLLSHVSRRAGSTCPHSLGGQDPLHRLLVGELFRPRAVPRPQPTPPRSSTRAPKSRSRCSGCPLVGR
jgi:hypothetical protein